MVVMCSGDRLFHLAIQKHWLIQGGGSGMPKTTQECAFLPQHMM